MRGTALAPCPLRRHRTWHRVPGPRQAPLALSTAQLASTVTRGRGWQRALRGSRPTPARRRLGALRESRGSPDLPKVAGTSIRRARAHGNRPGRASARLAAGPRSGTAGPRAVTLQKTGVPGGWHPGEPPPIPFLQHAALRAGTQPLWSFCCLVPSCPFRGGSPPGLAGLYLPCSPQPRPPWLFGSRDTRNGGGVCPCSSVCWGGSPALPARRCPALRMADPKYCEPHQSSHDPGDKYLRGGWRSGGAPGNACPSIWRG